MVAGPPATIYFRLVQAMGVRINGKIEPQLVLLGGVASFQPATATIMVHRATR